MNTRIFAITLILFSGLDLTDTHAQQAAPGSTEWQSQDIGRVGLNGDHNFEGKVHTVRGSGADIWSGADAFQYVFQPWTGDGELTVTS